MNAIVFLAFLILFINAKEIQRILKKEEKESFKFQAKNNFKKQANYFYGPILSEFIIKI